MDGADIDDEPRQNEAAKLRSDIRLRALVQGGKREGAAITLQKMIRGYLVRQKYAAVIRGAKRSKAKEDGRNLEAQSVKHDALRGPLMSYFNRRSTYNRRYQTKSTVLNDAESLKISEATSNSPPSGLNFVDANDERWENGELELLLMNFEGDKSDKSLNPLRHDFQENAIMTREDDEDSDEDEDEDEDEDNSEEDSDSKAANADKDPIEIQVSDSEENEAVGSFLSTKNTRRHNEVSLINRHKASDMLSDDARQGDSAGVFGQVGGEHIDIALARFGSASKIRGKNSVGHQANTDSESPSI